MNIVVISPHLDDGVLSLGGTMSEMVHEGHRVKMVTVFAGDPDRGGPPSLWDRPLGSKSASEVVVQRRDEDRRAAEVLGIEPVWLPFDDDAHLVRVVPDEIWEAVAPHLSEAARVFTPGWPLSHHDHRYTASLLLSRHNGPVPISFYGEPPLLAPFRHVRNGSRSSACRCIIGGRTPNGVDWSRSRFSRADLAAKIDALACYPGEISALGWHLPLSRRRRLQLACEQIGQS